LSLLMRQIGPTQSDKPSFSGGAFHASENPHFLGANLTFSR
jgi:hypothetical protein